jgi:hypothetical protein
MLRLCTRALILPFSLIVLSLTPCLAQQQTTKPAAAHTSVHYTVNHVVKWKDGTADTTKTFMAIPNAKDLVVDDEGKPASYGYAYEDLKGDGNKQLIIQGSGSMWCGAAGCATIILEQRDGKWAQLFSENIGDILAIMNEKANGYACIRAGFGDGMNMKSKVFFLKPANAQTRP